MPGNNFSGLRLLFAASVIFSHSAIVLTGDNKLEPHWGSVTLGSYAVDGFFLISGYLIVKSFDHDPTLSSFFRKRVLRLYPGFIINMLLCVFVLAPFVTPHYQAPFKELPRMLFLGGVPVEGALPGMPAPGLNGPVWTLAYEFRCYISVGVLGALFGFSRLRGFILSAAILLLAITALPLPESSGAVYVALGSPPASVRLFGMFAAGASFYLWRDRISYGNSLAAVSAVALALVPAIPAAANLVIAIAGGYLIFWAAFRLPQLSLSRFGNKTDLSYGTYLYAWPVQVTIAYVLHRHIPALALSLTALPIAAGLAYLSWTIVEKPAISLKPIQIAHARAREA